MQAWGCPAPLFALIRIRGAQSCEVPLCKGGQCSRCLKISSGGESRQNTRQLQYILGTVNKTIDSTAWDPNLRIDTVSLPCCFEIFRQADGRFTKFRTHLINSQHSAATKFLVPLSSSDPAPPAANKRGAKWSSISESAIVRCDRT